MLLYPTNTESMEMIIRLVDNSVLSVSGNIVTKEQVKHVHVGQTTACQDEQSYVYAYMDIYVCVISYSIPNTLSYKKIPVQDNTFRICTYTYRYPM